MESDKIVEVFEDLLNGYSKCEIMKRLGLSIKEWHQMEQTSHFKNLFEIPYHDPIMIIQQIEKDLFGSIEKLSEIKHNANNTAQRAALNKRINNLKMRYSTFLINKK